jgi:hypothetical protein
MSACPLTECFADLDDRDDDDEDDGSDVCAAEIAANASTAYSSRSGVRFELIGTS